MSLVTSIEDLMMSEETATARYQDGAPLEPSRAARDDSDARDLWSLSERLCGFSYGLPRAQPG